MRRRIGRPGAGSRAGLAESPAACRTNRAGTGAEGCRRGKNPHLSACLWAGGDHGRTVSGGPALRRKGVGTVCGDVRARACAVLECRAAAKVITDRMPPSRFPIDNGLNSQYCLGVAEVFWLHACLEEEFPV